MTDAKRSAVERNALRRAARLAKVLDGLHQVNANMTKLDGFTISEMGYVSYLLDKAGRSMKTTAKLLPLTTRDTT